MIHKAPFGLYDFFGYLASGLLIVVGMELVFGFPQILGRNLTIIEYRPFEKAREFVRSPGLRSQKEWAEYCKSGEKSDNIPATPERIYSKKWR